MFDSEENFKLDDWETKILRLKECLFCLISTGVQICLSSMNIRVLQIPLGYVQCMCVFWFMTLGGMRRMHFFYVECTIIVLGAFKRTKSSRYFDTHTINASANVPDKPYIQYISMESVISWINNGYLVPSCLQHTGQFSSLKFTVSKRGFTVY